MNIVSEVGMFQRNRIMCGMDGKSRKFDPGKGVVNTPLCVTEPRVPLRSNLDDPKEWELPCSDGESACWDEVHRTKLVSCCPIIKCGTMECAGSCLLSVAEYGYSWDGASHVRDLWEDQLGFSECFAS